MKLTDHTVSSFAELMASNLPAPGGGCACACEAAMGAALTAMVSAALMQDASEAPQAAAEAERLQKSFLGILEEDNLASCNVQSVRSLPQVTDQQKAVRAAALQRALKSQMGPPLRMMELAGETLTLAQSLADRTDASTAGDLGCAALALKSALMGAWLKGLCAASHLRDRAFVDSYRSRGRTLLDSALPLADNIYVTALNAL